MKLTDIEEKMEDLPNKGKKAILALIDTKTEYEMEKVLAKLDSIEKNFSFKLNTILWVISIMFALMTALKFIG